MTRTGGGGGAAVAGIQTTITLMMAALMIPGSKLTDVWGRTYCFILGLVVYAAGAVLAALAQGLWLLTLGYSVLVAAAANGNRPFVTAILVVVRHGHPRGGVLRRHRLGRRTAPPPLPATHAGGSPGLRVVLRDGPSAPCPRTRRW